MNAVQGAILRGDLNTHVEEASNVDKLFIAGKVCPSFSVDLKNGQYPKFRISTGELLNPDVTLRRPTGAYGRVTREYDVDSYDTQDRGLEELIDDSQKSDVMRFFNSEVQAAKFVLRSMMISYEIRVANLLMNATNFNATGAIAAYTAANLANGTIDFVGDILNAILLMTNTGYIPNAIILSSAVYTRIRRSTILQNYLRGNRPSDSQQMITTSQIADAFQVANVYVGYMPKNTAKKNQAASLSGIWTNAYVWVGEIAEGDPYNGGGARSFVWNKEGGLFVTETYRSEQQRSDVVRVRQHTVEKIIDANAGQLITTSYA
jgi:hypothetical protein